MTESIALDDVHAALKEVKIERGQPAVREILQRVAGVNSASELHASEYAAVIAAARGNESAIKPDGSIDTKAVYAKWNASGGRAKS
ncbi:MAG: hypothetical protein JZU55_19475 [Afipia sp.]|nr:hypothetical protein [Afipia sp.]